MPPPRYDLSDAGLARDTEIAFFTSGGPGGQHRNKRETAVRLTHRPSGIVVTSSKERSQAQNRADAMAKLRERLRQRMVKVKPRVKTAPTRASQRRRAEQKQRTGQKKAERRRRDFE